MKLPFPKEALAQHALLLGKTRSGKSSKMRLIVEHFLDDGVPVCVVDPKGDWWGLKSSADGKSAGYPVIIFGSEWAKFADVRINKHSGAEVGRLVATGNRPCVIDLKGMTVGDRTQFFIDFADAYFRHAEGKRVLAIDEVHNFAPQGKVIDPRAGMALHWANRLASEGAGMGIILLSASQRPQKVHKDYATSHETLIACRAVHKLDRDASGDWVDACGDREKKKELLDSLAGMNREEAWVYSPEIGFGPKQVIFPLFKTYDSFKPQDSKSPKKLKGWAEIDLSEVETKFAKLVEEHKANDPKALKVELAKVKGEKAALEKQMANAVAAKVIEKPVEKIVHVADPKAMAAAEQRGIAYGRAMGERFAFIEATKLFDDAIGRLKTTQARADERIAALHKATDAAATKFEKDSKSGSSPSSAVAPMGRQATVCTPMRAETLAVSARTPSPVASGDGTLPPGERAVLGAAIQFDGVDRDQLSVITGYKRSSRDAYIQRLREKGFVEANGQSVTPTEAGRAALPDYEPLPTGAALQDYWRDRLPDGERKVLEFLIGRYPDHAQREEIDEATGYKRSSRDAYIQRLKSRRLVITNGGGVTASETLF